MAASANPSSNNQEGAGNGNGATNNGRSVSVPHDNSVLGLAHNPGLAVDWTPEEQALLVELLNKYASEKIIYRYAKIAMQLPDKTVRDVALRCRWMNKKENGKRRKEDHSSGRKNKDKKEKVTDPTVKSASHAQSLISMDCDDGISYKDIGGVPGQLLEQNAHALEQISANFATFKLNENFNLFCQAQNNILSVLNNLSDMPEIMKQMPPLPVKLNEELANSILPGTSLQQNS